MATDNSNPLVSVIVISYNSSKYITETLESIKLQTYANIELIIADDCSSDDTIKICEEWLDNNSSRFKRFKIITADKNTGISPNCNRGLYEANGEWVKFIAGDDILINNCIEVFVGYSKLAKQTFFFSMLRYTVDNPNIISIFLKGYNLFNTKDNQLKILLRGNSLPAATAFMNKRDLLDIGGFDENYPMLEDYPLWIKAVKNKYKIVFLNEETVIYRIHKDSISDNNATIDITNPDFFSKNYRYHKSLYKFTKSVLIKEQFFNCLVFRGYKSLIFLLLFKTYTSFKKSHNFTFLLLYKFILLFSFTFYKKNLKL